MGDQEFRFIFGEPPDEVKQQIAEQMDRHQMAHQSVQHDINRLFSELDAEKLLSLRFLLHLSAENPIAAAFYEGMAASYLSVKYGVCACGQNHDEDLAEITDKPADEVRTIEREGGLEEIETFNEGVENELCIEYSVNAMGDGTVTCKNCGFASVSLQDRMLRPPGVAGCPGCQQKQKWG